MNSAIRDNLLVLRAGGLAVTSQATGDLLCASTATQFARLASAATGSVLASNGGGGCPSYQSLLFVNSTGRHIIGGGGTIANSVLRIDGASGVALGSIISLAKNGTDKAHIALTSAILGSGSSDDLAVYSNTGTGIYTNGANLRWGYNTAGDHTFGASSHIADSNGTPTKSSCTGGGCSWSIDTDSTDYAMSLTITTATTVTVAFGHTFSSNPVCVATPGSSAGVSMYISGGSSTTGFTLATSGSLVGVTAYILCRGF
jgi:hypothetical protein